MRTGTPSQKLAAALAVHPRARPVEPTNPGKPTGFASITFIQDADASGGYREVPPGHVMPSDTGKGVSPGRPGPE